MPSKVLVVGSGGRECALGYGLNVSKQVSKIYFVPGNAGTELFEKGSNIDLSFDELPDFCIKEKIDMVVIGPDAAVAAGLGDRLRAKKISVFGPNKAAGKLESSKAYATEFMEEFDISIPPSKIVTNQKQAEKAIEQFGGANQAVIKADGLAGGKGVFLPDSSLEARDAIEKILSGEVDKSGKKMVIQKRYHGPEVSVFVLSDGKTSKIIPVASQDHKRIGEGDTGPNTGGVGAYTPLPDWMLNASQWAKIKEISDKTFSGLKQKGIPYQGVLYLGLMLAEELNGAPVVIEYNARFGDPEAEVIVTQLVKNKIDLFPTLNLTALGQLSSYDMPSSLNGAVMTICLAAENYPEAPKVGDEIYGLNLKYDDVLIFHGNTKKEGSKIVSSGGRVIFICGYGQDLESAAKAAKAAIGPEGVHFRGMYYRRDIGHRVLSRIGAS